MDWIKDDKDGDTLIQQSMVKYARSHQFLGRLVYLKTVVGFFSFMEKS